MRFLKMLSPLRCVSCSILLTSTVVSATAADQDAKGKQLGNNDVSQVNSQNVPVQPVNENQKQANTDTANAVNRIKDVHVDPKDLQPPASDVPIRGFHPIKKMLQPIERLEKNSVQLEQQIMKLEGPIAGLQEPMLGLQKRMGSVEQRMLGVQEEISVVGSRADQVSSKIANISEQVSGVRNDLSDMRQRITNLSGPIKALQQPLVDVAQPLGMVNSELEKLAALITSILFAIVIAASVIVVGTPIAAILVYRNRHKLIPNLKDQDLTGREGAGNLGLDSEQSESSTKAA
jgi:peptidoglycan hydrolase CwlO-like protein